MRLIKAMLKIAAVKYLPDSQKTEASDMRQSTSDPQMYAPADTILRISFVVRAIKILTAIVTHPWIVATRVEDRINKDKSICSTNRTAIKMPLLSPEESV